MRTAQPLLHALCAAFLAGLCAPAIAADLPAPFVRLANVDASIRQDIRYAGSGNFLGRPAKGYQAAACILTLPAAQALARVQQALSAQGKTLVVFDCYRPATAVDDFVAWTKQGGPADPRWHPNVRRDDLIKDGYIGLFSSHSRGSTVDLAIASQAGDPATMPDCGLADSNTLDFGTGFDCFDRLSETAHRPLPEQAALNRKILVDAMKAQGFRNYTREWWHFTLATEPFPKQRFDFPVTAP